MRATRSAEGSSPKSVMRCGLRVIWDTIGGSCAIPMSSCNKILNRSANSGEHLGLRLFKLGQVGENLQALMDQVQFGSVFVSQVQFGSAHVSQVQFGSVLVSQVQFGSGLVSQVQFGSALVSQVQFGSAIVN